MNRNFGFIANKRNSTLPTQNAIFSLTERLTLISFLILFNNDPTPISSFYHKNTKTPNFTKLYFIKNMHFVFFYPVGYLSNLMSIFKTELSHGVKCLCVFVVIFAFITIRSKLNNVLL